MRDDRLSNVKTTNWDDTPPVLCLNRMFVTPACCARTRPAVDPGWPLRVEVTSTPARRSVHALRRGVLGRGARREAEELGPGCSITRWISW